MSETPENKVLLIEDEDHLAFTLKFNLEEEGFHVTPASNGKEALDLYFNNGPFDVVILDVMLPEMNGFSVLREIRSKDQMTNVIMLTARASDNDRIKGLGLGADDYITKPFHLEELIIKVKRASKRSKLINHNPTETPIISSTKVSIGPFNLDNEGLILETPNNSINITELEAKVLNTFMTNPHKIMSRKYLLKEVWGVNESVETRTVDNFIVRLRKYLEENPSKPQYLKSIRGRGYRFEVD